MVERVRAEIGADKYSEVEQHLENGLLVEGQLNGQRVATPLQGFFLHEGAELHEGLGVRLEVRPGLQEGLHLLDDVCREAAVGLDDGLQIQQHLDLLRLVHSGQEDVHVLRTGHLQLGGGQANALEEVAEQFNYMTTSSSPSFDFFFSDLVSLLLRISCN